MAINLIIVSALSGNYKYMKKEGHFALLFKKTVAIVKSPRYPGRQSSPDAAAREVNQKYGIPADATVFLFVGRINFIKNIDFTVRALARAKELGLRNFRMLFAGRGGRTRESSPPWCRNWVSRKKW